MIGSTTKRRWQILIGATLAATLIAGAGVVSQRADAEAGEHDPVVRKSASEMTPAEIDRFERAFSYAVGKGYLDDFNDEHNDHMRNRQHGADLLSTAPPAAVPGETPAYGFRLLPWHRAFIIEGEQMLRAALRERDRAEGRDPGEAEKLFIPYWDATHEQDLPGWVRAFQPRGGTAIVPEGVPPGHAAFGLPVGSRYHIRFGRWPGNNIVFDRLPQPAQVSQILAHEDFVSFYASIDVGVQIIQSAVPGARRGIATLERKVPSNTDVKILASALQPDYQQNPADPLAVFNAVLGVGYLATTEAARPHPDQELIGAVKAVYAAILFPPHIVLHLWAGGLKPDNPDVRGTVTNFNELAVDPAFWMLHAELDRWWYTWEQSHTGVPPLSGDDALFRPLTTVEGAWYGGGRQYSLSELTDTPSLPYRYGELYADRTHQHLIPALPPIPALPLRRAVR